MAKNFLSDKYLLLGIVLIVSLVAIVIIAKTPFSPLGIGTGGVQGNVIANKGNVLGGASATISDLRAIPEGSELDVTDAELEHLHSDGIDTSTKQFKDSRHYYFAKVNGKRIKLKFSDAGPTDLLSGTKVRIHGRRAQNDAVDAQALVAGDIVGTIDASSITVTAAAVPQAVKPHKLAVILILFNNSAAPKWTPEQVRGITFTNSNSINAFYYEQSFDKTGLIGKIRPDGDVFGWFTIPYRDDSLSCESGYNLWSNAARSMAAAQGIDLSGYDNVQYIWDYKPGCEWWGLGEVGSGQSWIAGNWGLGFPSADVQAHELGHNYGLQHSHSASCGAGMTGCTGNEYGDSYDVMGSGRYHFNNFQKSRSSLRSTGSWLDAANVRTVTATGTYALAPIEKASTGVQALTIRRPSSLSIGGQASGSGSTYYLEFRRPYGFDDFAPTNPVVTGITVRITDGSAHPWYLQTLAVGRTFIDPTGINFTTLSYDNASATVQITIAGTTPITDTIPPNVTLTAPANGTTVTGITTISANAADNIGVARVEFYVDSNLVNTAGSPYSFQWDTGLYTGGQHTIFARAYDASNNTRQSSTVTVTIPPDTTPPSVVIISPLPDSVVNGNISIGIIATDNKAISLLSFYVDGVLTRQSLMPPSITWYTALSADGQHNLTVKTMDTSGNNATSAVVPVTVSNVVHGGFNDVTMQTPSTGDTLSGSIVTVNARASTSDPRVTAKSIAYYRDSGIIIKSSTVWPYTVTFDSRLIANGQHTIYAVATDSLLSTQNSAPVTVTVSNTAALSIIAPASGASASGSSYRIIVQTLGTAKLKTLNISVDGITLKLLGGATNGNYNYTASWDTRYATNGPHTITAIATDVNGQTYTSDPSTAQVANTILPAMTYPISGSTVFGSAVKVQGVTTGSTAYIKKLEFFLDGAATPFKTAAASSYSFGWDARYTANGAHNIYVKATDVIGQTQSSAPVSFNLLNSVTVTLTAPANGAVLPRNKLALLSASTTGSAKVAWVDFLVDGVNVGTDTTAGYSYYWNASIPGTHTICADATDVTGGGGDSCDTPRTVTVS